MKLSTKMIIAIGVLLALFAAASLGASAETIAEEGTDPALDTADMLWVTVAAALVFIMSPGIALFYGGMLRKQSMTSTMAQCGLGTAIVFFIWTMIGYSLAFDGDIWGFIGGTGSMMVSGVPYDSSTLGLTVPDMEFLIFQGMFAAVTACIIVGASAERVRFPALMVFLAIWSVLVYAPMAHMVWGGGILSTAGGFITTLDYAGGTVVHICSGITGVAIALAVGKRSKRIIKDRPHNIPLMFLGAFLIWVGWIGFNGGSGLAVDGGMVNVLMNTVVSSVAAMIVWAAIQVATVGRVGVTGICAGLIAGLVAITPGCAYVNTPAAIAIGMMGALACYFGVSFMKKRSNVDDALDVFGLHGIGGICGAIATGIFAIPLLTDTPGLLHGGVDLFAGQLAAVGFTLVYCFAVSFAIMKGLSYVMRIRLTEEEEMIGADIIEHGESAYN
ncbi:MAG: ammonium transporter [Candidatus Methanoplasma sp.]|nr:ammonium transporter [Candidatus Methanoplasma sp.]